MLEFILTVMIGYYPITFILKTVKSFFALDLLTNKEKLPKWSIGWWVFSMILITLLTTGSYYLGLEVIETLKLMIL